MTEWSEAPLEHFLTRITYGFTNPMPTAEAGPFMVTARDINEGRVLYEQARRTTLEAYRNAITDKSRPKLGDVLVTKDGTLGRLALVDKEDVCINQSVALLQPDRNVRPRFLKYLIEHPPNFERMIGDADGTTIKHIYISRLAKMVVRVPPLATQDEIIGVLGALDDKIELNRRMNATLEAMARALFRSWFVDFDPVHATARGEAPAHMDPATAALFPDRFSEDGLPEGWNAGTLAELAHLNPEKWGKRNEPASVEYVDLANTKWGVIEAISRFGWNEAPSRARMVLRPDDTVVGTVRPGNGSYAFISESGLTGSTGFAVLRPRASRDSALLYLASTDPVNIAALANLADGGAYPAVRPDVVAASEVVVAPVAVRGAFAKEAKPMLDRIEAAKGENRNLAALRDALLPKLMSGELRVHEAERQVEAAE